jgi:hypothetical protein
VTASIDEPLFVLLQLTLLWVTGFRSHMGGGSAVVDTTGGWFSAAVFSKIRKGDSYS